MKRCVWLPVNLCLLCVFCLAALLAAPVAARADGVPSSTPDQQVWVTNGTVSAIATAPDGTTYIGGGFTYVGPNTGAAAALDPTSGAPDMSFPMVNGSVKASFELLRPWLKSCHITELASNYPYKELFGLMKKSGYDRWTLCEAAESKEPERFLKYYRALWRELMG